MKITVINGFKESTLEAYQRGTSCGIVVTHYFCFSPGSILLNVYEADELQ